MTDSSTLELAAIAGSCGSLTGRAGLMLEHVRRETPFDSAWIALAEPLNRRYRSLLTVDLDEPTHRYLTGAKMADDIETLQTNSGTAPLSPDRPHVAKDLATWKECLTPAGFGEALVMALFTADRRHVGLLALLWQSPRPQSRSVRRRLHQVIPILAAGIDPLRSLALSALMVEGASAGVALCRDGTPRLLPGLSGDSLLVEGSPVIALSRTFLTDRQVFTSFLWPSGDFCTSENYLRVTVMASPAEAPTGLLGAIVLAPAPHLHGLTPRELEVVGLVIEGLSNQQIAHTLVISLRTPATHLENILAKLDAPTRTLAAVRAERLGLYVPSPPARHRCSGEVMPDGPFAEPSSSVP